MRTFPHWLAAMGKCLLWNPSVKNQRFLPAPFGKGALRPVAADNAHGSFLLLVTSLTRPVSFYGAIPGFFRLSIDSVGKKCS